MTLDEKAEPFVRPIPPQMGRVDIGLHSIAFCPKQDLQSCVVDCSRSGFITAMGTSVYSFIRMVRPLNR